MTEFQVFVDRLKEGQDLLIDECCDPAFLEIQEKELQFPVPVTVEGTAYLTSDHLILQLSISTQARMPCAICNEFFHVPLIVEDLTHAEPLEEIVSHIFDYKELLREAILLQVPAFTECHNGQCPERSSMVNYMKKPRDPSQDRVHYPFNDL